MEYKIIWAATTALHKYNSRAGVYPMENTYYKAEQMEIKLSTTKTLYMERRENGSKNMVRENLIMNITRYKKRWPNTKWKTHVQEIMKEI